MTHSPEPVVRPTGGEHDANPPQADDDARRDFDHQHPPRVRLRLLQTVVATAGVVTFPLASLVLGRIGWRLLCGDGGSVLRHDLPQRGHEIVRQAVQDHAEAVGHEAVVAEAGSLGIVLGGSGNGEAMVANKVPGVRCGLCWSDDTAKWTRGHNDANCLALGERTVSPDTALHLVDLFLTTPFDGGRHQKRVDQIEG